MLASNSVTTNNRESQAIGRSDKMPLERRFPFSRPSVWAVAVTGFTFAVLQSVCTFFFALGAIRVFLGAGALVVASQFGEAWDHIFHGDSIRLPMTAVSVAGLLLSWASLRRVRRLRESPASQWRRRPVTARQMKWERWQIAFQIVTFVLLVVEEWMHVRTFHRF